MYKTRKKSGEIREIVIKRGQEGRDDREILCGKLHGPEVPAQQTHRT